MIIANIIGGLGNQMFQYATARAISLELGTSLRLDISGYDKYKLHQGFELQRIFNSTIEIASEMDRRIVLGWQSTTFSRKLLLRQRMAWLRSKSFVIEPHFQYWQGLAEIPNDCYLMGYWQSEKYFSLAEARIRTDFSFKLPLQNKNAEVARKILQANSVSLHVRRGDYATKPQTTATHGLCTLDYYGQSIQYVAERVQQPKFFIFSDDIAWARDNLNISHQCQYVDVNQGEESYNDMRLMSMCNHHIIANSSFSWWGAWLNPKRDKIVVAPKNWFADKTDAIDLLPQSWIKL
ncbi:alpha-1,2-fucosyltransferase [Burkholderiaceae bacterium]|nr:alpha-1,2-fucosyltransferase [Burkholderiaceae bacterium]